MDFGLVPYLPQVITSSVLDRFAGALCFKLMGLLAAALYPTVMLIVSIIEDVVPSGK